MFFLPLPLNKTLETLDQVESHNNGASSLPNPELYIIVNGKPTTSKVVWRSLVNVDNVETAVQKLIDNRQQHLDVMCFPKLYPTGKFGKHHPRDVKISHSEFDNTTKCLI